MSTHPFAGMYAALLTPLTQHGQLDALVAQKLLLHLTSLGLDGAYVAGTTGEGMRLSIDTRQELVERLMEVLPKGKRMFVHVGTADVRDSIRLSEHAALQGADAISSLPPAADSRQVKAFYEELAKHSPLPLIVYYFPKAAPLAFHTPQELLDICDLPNVLGVKFTDFNLYLLNRLVKCGQLVFNGYDEALAPGLLMGAQGGIGTTYNLLAPVFIQIFRLAKAGNWEAARRLQSDCNAVLDILFRYPFFPAVREAVRHMGFDCGPMASEDAFASEAQRQQFLRDMNDNLPDTVANEIGWSNSSEVRA